MRRLTVREQEVIALITQGLSTKEIAEQLYIGVRTVEAFVRILYEKVEVNNKVQLATYWLSKGVLDHGQQPKKLLPPSYDQALKLLVKSPGLCTTNVATRIGTSYKYAYSILKKMEKRDLVFSHSTKKREDRFEWYPTIEILAQSFELSEDEIVVWLTDLASRQPSQVMPPGKP